MNKHNKLLLLIAQCLICMVYISIALFCVVKVLDKRATNLHKQHIQTDTILVEDTYYIIKLYKTDIKYEQ